MFQLVVAAAVVAANPADAARLERMVALYDELCLDVFPDDAGVAALMVAKGATPLTADEVRVTFNDDPGRGWLLEDGDLKVQIMLEMPPYHACSVRWMTDNGFGDLSGYEAVTDEFKATRPAFAEPESQEGDVGDFHVAATTESRPLVDGGTEALLAIEQRVTDAQRLANGETRVSVRFVHQIISPGAR
jgi:hypothetical protein